MAYYRPCKNCLFEKENCTRKAEICSVIAGAGVTSISFRCEMRKPLYVVGQRVLFPWRIFDSVDGCDVDENVATFAGTILFEAPPVRYVVRVDRGFCLSMRDPDWDRVKAEDIFTRNKDRLIIKVKTKDITPLAQKHKPICEECGSYEGEDTCLGWGGLAPLNGYWPAKCAKREKNQ